MKQETSVNDITSTGIKIQAQQYDNSSTSFSSTFETTGSAPFQVTTQSATGKNQGEDECERLRSHDIDDDDDESNNNGPDEPKNCKTFEVESATNPINPSGATSVNAAKSREQVQSPLSSSSLSSSSAAGTKTGPSASWKTFQYQSHSLGIAVSDLAAMTGFHPFKRLPKLLMDHVYQGTRGNMLLRHDAALLGYTIVEEDQDEVMLRSLAEKSNSSALSKAVSKAIDVKRGTKQVNTIDRVTKLQQTIHTHAATNKLLTKTEGMQLQEGTRHFLHTGFGTCWEEAALDVYEKMYGSTVEQRNSELRIWPFQKKDETIAHSSENGANTTTLTLTPIRDAFGIPWKQLRNQRKQARHKQKRPRRQGQKRKRSTDEAKNSETNGRSNDDCASSVAPVISTTSNTTTKTSASSPNDTSVVPSTKVASENSNDTSVVVDLTVSDSDDNAKSCSKGEQTQNDITNRHQEQQLPYCVLRGNVDGIRSELVPNNNYVRTMSDEFESDEDHHDDAESWILQPIIVECKHRMTRFQNSAPLYEQIQVVAYCFMYKVQAADLVQVMRVLKQPRRKSHKKTAKQTKPGAIKEWLSKSTVKSSSNDDTHEQEQHNDVKRCEIGRAINKEIAKKSAVSFTESEASSPGVKEKSPSSVSNQGLSHKSDSESQCGEPIAFKAKPNTDEENANILADSISARITTDATKSDSTSDVSNTSRSGSDCEQNTRDGDSASESPCGTTGNATTKNSSAYQEKSHEKEKTRNTRNRHKRDSKVQVKIAVNRISLDDPIYHHCQNWHDTILPRVRSWVDAVYSVRSNDDKRYRLLTAMTMMTNPSNYTCNSTDDEQSSCCTDHSTIREMGVDSSSHQRKHLINAWKVVFEECPWLQECDTAYHRDIMLFSR